ncbi:MAG TPA: ATP-binding protein, partial [Mucilaginibacter sp.]|nr:ATP-binding protein [Mucilaginibacter sp.]
IGVINLLKKEKDEVRQDEYFQILKYCSDHMLHQVNNILDFNKIEAGKLEIHPIELNLRQLLMNVGTPFIALFREKGVDLKVEADPGLDVTVLADDVRLIQIFNNLFSNALKFTDSGYVKLAAVCKNKDRFGVEVGFSVEDTGLGIARHDQEKIFERFGQVYHEDTKKTGTGLGLTICVRLLKLMGSQLKLESEEGKGSRFSFDLKFEQVSDRHFSKPNEMNGDNLAGIKVLLAEDNQLNMMVAKKILKGFEASVTPAYNGREVLDELKKDAAYDVILMDLEMPVMSGYDAIYEVKKLYPGIPVIAFTASLVDQKMLSDLIESGFSDCMLKPFQPRQLLSDVKKHLIKPGIHLN